MTEDLHPRFPALTVEQIAEWERFQMVEPFGEEWMQTATVCRTLTGWKEPFETFMPTLVKPRARQQSVEEQIAAFRAALSGGVPDRGMVKRPT